MNLYQRINEVRKKIDYIKKDKNVQGYQAVTHDAVTALVRDHLVEFGVVIFPNLVSAVTVDTGTMTSKETPIIRVEGVYDFTLVNVDDPAERHTVRVSAHALDHGDKAPGKLLSYAKKAFVLKVFEIESGEDDESRYDLHDEPETQQPAKAKRVTREVFDSLTKEVQTYLADCAIPVKDLLNQGAVGDAVDKLQSIQYDDEQQRVAMWSLFASSERSAMTRVLEFRKLKKDK
jgi:hypothetical protein